MLGRSLSAQRVETDPAKGISDQTVARLRRLVEVGGDPERPEILDDLRHHSLDRLVITDIDLDPQSGAARRLNLTTSKCSSTMRISSLARTLQAPLAERNNRAF